MAITSGFFDSISGDRTYSAEQMTTYFEGLVSDGVYESIGDRFAVTAGTGMTVSVGSGRALLKSHWVKNDAAASVTLDAADVQHPRYDAIVLRLDLTESGRDISIAVKKGTAAAAPTAPEVTRTSTIHELLLAVVRVRKNASSVLQSDITDMRPSSSCGWVTGVVKQVDTSDLFLQYQAAYEYYYTSCTAAFDAYLAAKKAAFDEWYADLTQTLEVNAGVSKYQRSVQEVGTVSEVTIGIPSYDPEYDTLFVYINGILMIEYKEYVIGDNKITFANPITGTNEVTFIVLKNEIGRSVALAGEAIAVLDGETDSETGILEPIT